MPTNQSVSVPQRPQQQLKECALCPCEYQAARHDATTRADLVRTKQPDGFYRMCLTFSEALQPVRQVARQEAHRQNPRKILQCSANPLATQCPVLLRNRGVSRSSVSLCMLTDWARGAVRPGCRYHPSPCHWPMFCWEGSRQLLGSELHPNSPNLGSHGTIILYPPPPATQDGKSLTLQSVN
ncbi:hypothetical protein DPEC_G00233420 [Dallia pectoralis]|uniref:Uncharacterized protein n=1 Tax=Dallia pectoralis TaxID=75939 RepID=A0ACC2FXL1_DALPE|nr:hypothetical protein DPEC_G00233420 [Dallia pectoralis]